ncbi:MAG: tetratricopeptide repeat protein [Bacteroidia bacterium]|nr:tetratricopeptide repeat protein [Bacteroidia bacterium]
MRIRRSVWVLGGLFITIACLTQFCTTPSTPSENQSLYLNHGDSAHYVGLETCAECHIDKAQTFVHTGMGMSFDTVSRTKSSANLETRHVLYDSFLDLHYYPYWKENELWLKEFRLEQKDTVYIREERISYIIGSGQHTNSHLIRKGDYIVQAPFTWYAQKKQLDFPPGFENGANSRFRRVIDEECMSCHNGLPEMKVGSDRAFVSVPKGIDCERCHGPGSIHVDRRRLGLEPDGDVDYSIVNPSKLSWERQIDVCQRCHLQGNNVLKPGKTFHDFRPGMVLADVFEIYLPQYSGEDEQLFNMANHADRFQNSKCFLATNRKDKGAQFTCITCHNPHVSVKETETKVFNSTCVKCHSDASSCTETLAARTAVSNNCVHCHMPVSGTEDIPHVTVHDHKIGIYKDGTPKNNGEVVGLYSVNNPSPQTRTLIEAYLTYFEKFDPLPVYQQKAEELLKQEEYPELKIHLLYQKQSWRELTEYIERKSIEEVKGITCYRVGKAYQYAGNVPKAIEWLRLAVLKEPTRFEYKSELGSVLMQNNQWNQAEDVLLACEKQFNEYNPTLNNLGFLYLNMGKFAQAKSYLNQSLKYDPDNVNALENMVLLYSKLGDKESELRWLKMLLKVNPQHQAAQSRLNVLRSS